MKKKVLAVLISVALIFGTVGCGIEELYENTKNNQPGTDKEGNADSGKRGDERAEFLLLRI